MVKNYNRIHTLSIHNDQSFDCFHVGTLPIGITIIPIKSRFVERLNYDCNLINLRFPVMSFKSNNVTKLIA